MHDHIAAVEQHPPILRRALKALCRDMNLVELVFDGARDRLNLPRIVAGTDDKVVSYD